jgi:hypothetical protein
MTLTAMVSTTAFATWISGLYVTAGETVQVVRSRGIGEELPAKPDRLVIVARTGGPGLALEGAFDVPTFQLRWRGGQNDPDDAEQLADLGDRLLLEAPMPTTIDGHHVTLIDRTGSPPTEFRRDTARRTHLTGNYFLRLARY